MEEIDFFDEGGEATFYFFFQKRFLAHFSITFLSAIQVLVRYENLSYFFAEYHSLETPLYCKSKTLKTNLFPGMPGAISGRDAAGPPLLWRPLHHRGRRPLAGRRPAL